MTEQQERPAWTINYSRAEDLRNIEGFDHPWRLIFVITAAALSPGTTVHTGMAAQYDPGITLGELADPNPGIQGVNVSEGFSVDNLRLFLQTLNSAEFRQGLTNYNCGDPVPQFKFSVTLRKDPDREHTNALMVDWQFTPPLLPFGTNRGLHAGLFYSAEKELAKLDPGPHRFVLYEPILDCSKRGVVELWGKYSKTAEVLVAGKTPPKEVEAEADRSAVLDLPALPPTGRKARLLTRERALAKLPVDAIREALTVDQNFRHTACGENRGAKDAET